jgi:DNA polymerase III subunit delta
MSPEPAPSIYLLYGNDAVGIQTRLGEIQANMDEDSTGGLNTMHLDGSRASLDELRNAVMMMPFMVARRLVIVNTPSRLFPKSDSEDKFKNLLEVMPSTTLLVLIEHGDLKVEIKRRMVDHWLIDWVRKRAGSAKTQKIDPPADLTGWIQARATMHGGRFTREAAKTLAELVAGDTRAADQEIQKLLAYANYKRDIKEDDVNLLSADISEDSIFALVDSIGGRNRQRAVELLNRMLESQEPLSLFGMIVRQFRLLLVAREVLDDGGGEREIARALKIQDFMARKLIPQARQFTLPDLETIYRHLLEIDKGVKTGQTDWNVALNMLLAVVTR